MGLFGEGKTPEIAIRDGRGEGVPLSFASGEPNRDGAEEGLAEGNRGRQITSSDQPQKREAFLERLQKAADLSGNEIPVNIKGPEQFDEFRREFLFLIQLDGLCKRSGRS